MKRLIAYTVIILIALTGATKTAHSQTAMPLVMKKVDGKWVPADSADRANAPQMPLDPKFAYNPDDISARIDSLLALSDTATMSPYRFMPNYYFMPAIFDGYDLSYSDFAPNFSTKFVPSLSTVTVNNDTPRTWLDDLADTHEHYLLMKQNYMINHPEQVRYNMSQLPQAPKTKRSKMEGKQPKLTITQPTVDKKQLNSEIGSPELQRKNWLHSFESQLQFSQAYISPNWYQGGNNNLNFILNAGWDVKLNSNYHPKLLFENSIHYKLALNSAPEDTLRNYSISEDLFQINTRFGIKAHKRWYYSATLQFKTQFLNNYAPNTRNLMASLLSPGELNVGLGMTYNYENAKKTFNISASISPASYNFKSDINNRRINPTGFGIKPGHKFVNEIGSGVDGTLTWQIVYNIKLVSRLTAFTDYSYIQADWQNTLSFNINRFLSTQLFVHLRYDTQTPAVLDSRWHKLQLKEILSFGFAYKISPTS